MSGGQPAATWTFSSWRPAGRLLRGVRLTLLFMLGLAASGQGATAVAGSASSGCRHANGPYRVVGNHLVDHLGHRFTPEGITVFGLALPDWSAQVGLDEAQIRAMANHWCANTVRIQAAPANLFSGNSPAPSVNMAFVAALKAEVKLARRLGLSVIITAQTEQTGQVVNNVRQVLPTKITLQYWRELAALFRRNPGTMFDLFNEPRLFAGDQTWSLWRNGGTYHGVHYLGMQRLVSSLRRAGTGHVFIVEGPNYSNTLAGVDSDPIVGTDIVYSIHHPAGPDTKSQWKMDFGSLARKHPVLEGEWTQYASRRRECWPDATTKVPLFLSYLRKKQIGLVVWALLPGVLITDAGQYNSPTTIQSNYACVNGLDQGAGQLIQQYFHAMNR